MTTSGDTYDSSGSSPAHHSLKTFKQPHQQLLKTGLILSFLVVAVLVWILILHQLKDTQKAIFKGLTLEHSNLSTIMAKNFLQILDQEHAIQIFVEKALNHPHKGSLDPIHDFLYGERAFNRIVLFDLDGRAFFQTSPRDYSHVDVARLKQRFRAVINRNRPPGISTLLTPKDASWQVPLLFPVKKDRLAVAMMLLELDLGYVLNLYQDINFGRSGRIIIYTGTGRELVRFESAGLVLGPEKQQLSSATLRDLKTARRGLSAPQILNGRHIIFCKVPNYPFIISVSKDLDEALAHVQQKKTEQLWILSLITLTATLLCYTLIQALNRKQQYYLALAASHRENSRLLKTLEVEHQKAVNAASFDALTNLYNRRLFISLARKNLKLAKRNRFVYAVMFIDLDRFKTINDTLGHDAGDRLLQEVAARLTSCVRESDIVARFGGDEFAVMLTAIMPETKISHIADKIMATLSQPCRNVDGHTLATSPSIGIALYPGDGENIEDLLRNADTAMYHSKGKGRGRYSFFDPSLNPLSAERAELEQRLPAAIARGEFVFHYQPKIRLSDYRVVGLEALIRWQHPDHNLIYPEDFIPGAEAGGAIIELGKWAVEEACRQQALWRTQAVPRVPVAVNISPRQLQETDFADFFLATLERYDLEPAEIDIEVTETTLLGETGPAMNNLSKLSQKGVNIALDDFGADFSHLSHDQLRPARALKIDRSFIRDIRNYPNDNTVVSSTITLAQKFNLTVIAEGVESHGQLVHLKVAGCDQVQGYFFCRPAPEQDIREFLFSPTRTPGT